ncbi:MAG: aminomethyltransferase family protein [Burkholderiales bacterium]|nr:aminomethyltransferase family protein [Burkholderiales bacterium]MDE1925846.1 aminomethyltransferase family protein [Burkholderiales bacterium]MDE2160444.1 aminomethyltransferase family protein [Burkholderiales bacterium]MDE2503057.1 aminomethyltransferase family protein [Burkholderiales bacterium]
MRRNSVLNERHVKLGSKLDGEMWNDMPIPWHYRSDAHDEVVATRTRAGLYDVSALNLINVRGADAAAVIDRLVTIDVHRLEPGQSRLAAEVDEDGSLVDDIMIIRDGAQQFRISHGSGATPATLAALAEGRKVVVEPDRDVHVLSLQGPKSLAVLGPLVGPRLARLPYFRHLKAELFGRKVVIGRGGYSGERGYEVYCAAADAVFLWDSILEAGQGHGVIPASWTALDLTRVEGALLFFPYDMPEGDTTPWEVNMHWAIDADKKADYIGKAALARLKGRERFRQAGMLVHASTAVPVGTPIFAGKRRVGSVTSSSYSRLLMQSLAMVHLVPSHANLGTALTLRTVDEELAGLVVRTPFYDPLRLRTHPEQLRG